MNAPASDGAAADVFLAADVGGTHARIGLVRAGVSDRPAVDVLAHRKYACADFPGLAAILADFRASQRTGLEHVVIACAGVVLEQRVVNANLPWPVEVPALKRELGLRHIVCINDFQAAAHAEQCMDPAVTRLLTPAATAPAPGPVLVLGPGTGLGAAVRIPHAGGWLVLPTEVGHTAFAPGTPREMDVLRVQQRRSRHVATEQLVSGPGLVNLYRSLCVLDGETPSFEQPAAISQAAREGDELAREAVRMFCALLGSVIGDLCLFSGATSVFVAGGILPQLHDFVPASDFHARMTDKGTLMRPMLERIPVRLIEDDLFGVIGAASWYLQHSAAVRP